MSTSPRQSRSGRRPQLLPVGLLALTLNDSQAGEAISDAILRLVSPP